MAKLKSPDQSVVLLFHSETGSGLPVHRIADFLNALEEAYNALLLLDNLTEDYGASLKSKTSGFGSSGCATSGVLGAY